jgi:hypothetical protein
MLRMNKSNSTCEKNEWMRSACKGLPFYKKHEDKRYCVLHYPHKDKVLDFKMAFDNKIKDNDLDFSGVWFPEKLSFTNHTFTTDAHFPNAVFSEGADFMRVTFQQNVYFSESEFTQRTQFVETKFYLEADFHLATFQYLASFLLSEFKEKAIFDNAKFLNQSDAYFYSAIFNKELDLGQAVFSGLANFSYATFGSLADFSGAHFSAKTDFSNSVFKDYARFSSNGNTQLFDDQVSLDFQHARIEKPDRVSFHTLTLRPHWFVNVDSREFVFTDVKWDWEDIEISREIDRLKEKGIESPHRLFSKACRELAINAEENHLYEDASKFRFMAMETERLKDSNGFVDSTKATFKAVNSLIREAETDDAPARLPEIWRGQKKHFQSGRTWSFSKTLRLLYRVLSGYGERVGRAFFILFALWLFFALLYYIFEPFSFGRALSYSLAVMTFQRPDPKPTSDWASAFVAIEAVLGPLQAALLALAIRRKFMR